ncbi:formate dehydrogenase subunit gamma [Acidisphaera sp. L21]|uniref:formate dehydrogenase subunit gamma n=1 Tax=Acidisphaera sp. L21 TaxID=1641851 RepID=UPI00131DCF66|nr:formate dehydrogenase subunit gamma [Acidisphaera sp. L21]
MAKSSRGRPPARPIAPSWPGAQQAQQIIDAHRTMAGPMLPLLHAMQEAFGYVPTEAEPQIAEALNLSRAEVYGVISFYHEFRREPGGRHVLKLCRAEACQAMGADALARGLLRRLSLEWGGKTADGALTVEPVFCLGLCACAPAALYDGAPIGRVDAEALDDILADAR